MRTPSTQSPLLPLVCSFALHALGVLGGWYVVAGEQRSPLEMGVCLAETSDRLKLSVIFGDGGESRRPAAISTKQIEEPPPHQDTEVKLVEPTGFNPIEVLPPAPTVGTSAPGNVGTQDHASHSPGERGTGGPPTGIRFLEVGASGKSVVYVLDRSLSMGMHESFDRARLELLRSLQHLPADVQFQVLAYNEQEPHFLVAPEHLLPARPEIVGQFVQAVNALLPRGSTNHVNALRHALVYYPDVIYFVTDADDLTLKDVQAITALNQGKTAIHVLEMVSRRLPQLEGPLLQLASDNRGTYRGVSAGQ